MIALFMSHLLRSEHASSRRIGDGEGKQMSCVLVTNNGTPPMKIFTCYCMVFDIKVVEKNKKQLLEQ